MSKKNKTEMNLLSILFFYFRQQLDFRYKELENAKERVNHLQSNFIVNDKLDFYEHYKRNEFKTMWDANKNNPGYKNSNEMPSNKIIAKMYSNPNDSGLTANAQYGAFLKNQIGHKI